MLIKYIGHACFKIRDNETGYSIVIDPYEPDSVPGFRKIVDLASEVLCTHDHFDHNYTDAIRIEPADESPYEVKVIETWHDDVKGAKRGPNKIYVIIDKKTGERLVHYGDIGEVMDDLLIIFCESLYVSGYIGIIFPVFLSIPFSSNTGDFISYVPFLFSIFPKNVYVWPNINLSFKYF